MPSRRTAPGAAEYFAQVSERFRIARQLVENRQVDAARQCGCDPNAWNRYEHALREPDMFTLAKFCIQYDIDPRFLLLGDPSGLRWPLAANLRLVPGGEKYLPEPPPGTAAPASPGAKHHVVGAPDRTKQLARLP